MAMKLRLLRRNQPPTAPPADSEQQIRLIRENIQRLELRASRGLWSLALFTALSIVVHRLAGEFAVYVSHWRELLGAPPPVNLLHFGLVIYVFAATIRVLTKMMNGDQPHGSFNPLFYLTAFYLFYGLSGALQEHFWAICAAGMTILGLESCHVWTACREALQEEKDRLARLERLTHGIAPQE